LNICVFAGSSTGRRTSYGQVARQLGEELASRNIGLVYGGSSAGLMGVVADAALGNGGRVIGVLPQSLAAVEIAHAGLTELRIVSTMHERKAIMAELSSAFVVLPGGLGSMDESFEVWTWSQLGIHSKPIGLLNVDGFYDGLERFLDHLVEEAFVKQIHRNILLSDEDPARLIDSLLDADVPVAGKWITPQSPGQGPE
jgi:uncharacterized protein (TIGR00730 family)